MMQDKVLDGTAALSAVAAIFIVLAIVFWLFASAKFVLHAGERDRSDVFSLTAFTAHLACIALAMVINGQFSLLIVLGSGAVLALLSIVFAMRSQSIIGRRMKAATLLWVVGIILGIGTSHH